jgi:hypothetical protein
MNTNIYLGVALAACLSIPSTHLLAEVAPASSDSDVMYPSEKQLEQEAQQTGKSIDEPLKPAKHYKVPKKHKKAHIKEPSEKKMEQK